MRGEDLLPVGSQLHQGQQTAGFGHFRDDLEAEAPAGMLGGRLHLGQDTWRVDTHADKASTMNNAANRRRMTFSRERRSDPAREELDLQG